MPIETATLTQEGLHPGALQAESLRQLAILEPEGVYTITRTYQRTKAVLLEAHFDRLEESAQLEGINLKLDRARLRKGLRELIDQAGFQESRLRITVPLQEPAKLLLAAEPLQPVPDQLKKNGVAAATVKLERRNPRSKTNTWEPQRMAAAEELTWDIYEGILVDDEGNLLEGFGSNFYGIIDGVLHTAERGILQGISRHILLQVVPEKMAVETSPINVDQLHRLQEAFLTSSSRGVLPIVSIDGQAIDGGTPGVQTQRLSQRYDDWVQHHLEPI
ncbi:MAG: aminotransferase class IV [Anaerolineales bacterium]